MWDIQGTQSRSFAGMGFGAVMMVTVPLSYRLHHAQRRAEVLQLLTLNLSWRGG